MAEALAAALAQALGLPVPAPATVTLDAGFGSGEPDPEIQDLLAKGNEAQAIKRYRERTGVGIAEAQQAIERAQSTD